VAAEIPESDVHSRREFALPVDIRIASQATTVAVGAGPDAGEEQSGTTNPPAPALTAPLDSAIVYYNVIQMEEVLTLRLPKGSRRRLTQLAKRKRQNLSQYVRDAIEAQLWIDALDETVALAAPKAAALGVKTDDDVFRLFS